MKHMSIKLRADTTQITVVLFLREVSVDPIVEMIQKLFMLQAI